MKVARYNYRAQFGETPEDLFSSIREMLMNGQYILTGHVEQFEREFAAYLGVAQTLGVNSGTDALVIGLCAIGVGPGDEVITQANTFHATVAAIRHVGATPVLVDADEESFLINEDQVAAVITERTRVILPVHLYGKPAPMLRLLDLAARYGLLVVEDAAQAHGARIHNRRAGSFGQVACFSFHPSKNLAAAGDGGAIATSSPEIADRIRRLRELGQDGQNNHTTLGFNSKLDAIQARVLAWKLPDLDLWNERRGEIAALYRERLSELPLRCQSANPEEKHAYHLFQIRTSERDALLRHLQDSGIDAVVRYPVPIHLQEAFRDCNWQQGQFPVSERLAKELLCLPIRPDLTIDELDYVCEQTRLFFKRQPASARPLEHAVPG
jgi:dTDP-4-amino-4,6-dideoxygalactose transaminase